MCTRETWRSFDTQWLQDRLCAIQQCTSCGEHRAVVIENATVVGIDQAGTEDESDGGDTTDSPNDYGW